LSAAANAKVDRIETDVGVGVDNSLPQGASPAIERVGHREGGRRADGRNAEQNDDWVEDACFHRLFSRSHMGFGFISDKEEFRRMLQNLV
jgi:hypothetical protein